MINIPKIKNQLEAERSAHIEFKKTRPAAKIVAATTIKLTNLNALIH